METILAINTRQSRETNTTINQVMSKISGIQHKIARSHLDPVQRITILKELNSINESVSRLKR